MAEPELSELHLADLDEMVALEARAFAAEIRATREKYALRFARGHTAIGLRRDGKLVGIASFRAATYSVDAPHGFPRTFEQFSNAWHVPGGRAMAFYNLGLDRDQRNLKHLRWLLRGAFGRARELGCEVMFADGPLMSLTGNEQIAPAAELQRAISRFANEGVFPNDTEFLRDPILATYHRLTGCRFLWLLPDFIPEDSASAGWRVILYLELDSLANKLF